MFKIEKAPGEASLRVYKSERGRGGGNYDLQSHDGRMEGSLNARMTAVGILYIAV